MVLLVAVTDVFVDATVTADAALTTAVPVSTGVRITVSAASGVVVVEVSVNVTGVPTAPVAVAAVAEPPSVAEDAVMVLAWPPVAAFDGADVRTQIQAILQQQAQCA